CTKCYPAVQIPTKNYQRVLEHNGAHILFDESLQRADQPCGLCLRPFPMCTFVFLKRSGTATARQIDWAQSKCLNGSRKAKKCQIMTAAMRSSEKSPCTNHLIECPLQCGSVVWTYNLTTHYQGSYHNLSSLSNIPVFYRMVGHEMEWMKTVWTDRQIQPTACPLKKKRSRAPLRISDAHKSIMALW
ncbi:hypothetical protein B0H13DRAFT_1594740, partial [Mycena leptocephala]